MSKYLKMLNLVKKILSFFESFNIIMQDKACHILFLVKYFSF